MSKADLRVDAAFPGGNIIVDSIEGDTLNVRQELRDTNTDWFYWCFRVTGGAGRTLTVRFTASNVIGARGPAVSLDGGWTWAWLGMDSLVEKQAFRYAVPAGADEVRFSFGMPYLQANWQRFAARFAGHPHFRAGVLCRTAKGRDAEKALAGRLDGQAPHKVFLTARHHCCEMMASYALEGLLESVLTEPAGAWLRENAEILAIPFMDKDGVEQGDQGKNRAPRDHNRDYVGESLYETTRAVRETVPAWAGDRIRLALDMHCPWIRGERNEAIYFVGGPHAGNWERAEEFCRILARVQKGPLVYNPADNLPFGVGWNNAANHVGGRPCSDWTAHLPGIRVGTSVEIPYANASGVDVTAESARLLGRDLAAAIGEFLRG